MHHSDHVISELMHHQSTNYAFILQYKQNVLISLSHRSIWFLRSTYQLVHDVVDLEGLQDVADELRMDVRSLNLSVEQLPHRTLDRQSGMQSSYNSSKKHQSISSQATCHVRKECRHAMLPTSNFGEIFCGLYETLSSGMPYSDDVESGLIRPASLW